MKPSGHERPDLQMATGAIGTRSAAFFDLDNTLISGSSLFHLGWGGFKRGMFSPLEAACFTLANLRFVLTRRELEGAPQIWGNFAASFVKGAEVAEMVSIGREIIDESIRPAIRALVVEMAKRHLERGNEVWIVTASPQELSQMLAENLGFTGGIGTRAQVVDGRYSGRIPQGILHGPEKAKAVVSLAWERGIDLATSSAYSDSINDLPMLLSVGFPNAVTPDRELALKAARSGWPVHELKVR
jgi:HAD superfamily hydrolase (TIGR01490 family)